MYKERFVEAASAPIGIKFSMNNQRLISKLLMYGSVFLSVLLFVFFVTTDTYPYWAVALQLASGASFLLSVVFDSPKKPVLTLNKTEIVIGLAIGIGVLTLYLFRISQITPGVWGDEVALGVMVEKLRTAGDAPPFIAYNLGHPTPLVFFSMLAVTLLGKSVVALRLVSVFFGALSAVAMYALLRQVISRFFAVCGVLIFSTSYMVLVVARFAYEITAGMTATVFALLLLLLLRKKVSTVALVLLGTTIGLGLYTYLGFRVIALVLFIAAAVLIVTEAKHKLQSFLLFCVSICIVVNPLFAFSIRHASILNERVASLLVFNQGLPAAEVRNELAGAAKRTLGMFFMTGDPNPRQNPASTTPIDTATSILFITGIILLFYRQRSWAVLAAALAGAILLSEIVTLEKIPEFHYYGLGHPNTLRIAQLAPIISVVAFWCLHEVSKLISDLQARKVGVATVTGIIVLINVSHYFNQKPSMWIHTTNYVTDMAVVAEINQEKPSRVALSPSFEKSQHVGYFLDSSISVEPMHDPSQCKIQYTEVPLYIHNVDLQHCSQEDLEKLVDSSNSSITVHKNEWDFVDYVTVGAD